MGLKFLQMVEDNKYDLVMKFCRENVFGTTEGNPTEGSTVSLEADFQKAGFQTDRTCSATLMLATDVEDEIC